MDKKSLTEADIRTKFITPALAGPDGSGKMPRYFQMVAIARGDDSILPRLLSGELRVKDAERFVEAVV